MGKLIFFLIATISLNFSPSAQIPIIRGVKVEVKFTKCQID